MNKKTFLLTALCALPILAFGEGFSLKQCIDYANKANGNIVNANYDVEIAGRKVKEQIGSMLPQIDGSATYTDNILLPTQLIPDFLNPGSTEMLKVQFGTQYNLGGSVQLTQKLFDPTFPLALKASKLSETQAQQSLKMTKEQSAYSISVTYFQTLVIGKQLSTLRSTLSTSAKQLTSTELRFQNGMAKQIDVDKIRVSFNNLKSQVQQAELNYAQSLSNLKNYMGMPVSTAIALTDTVMSIDNQSLEALLSDFKVENRTDYQLQEIALKAFEADKERNKAGYLPSLNFTANLASSAQRKEMNFLDSSQPWFTSSALIFSLRIPIFDGLQRQQRIAQANLNIQKSKVKMEQSKQAIQVDLSNYENQYRTAVNNIQNEKENLTLSESVYKNTQLQYQQGVATSLDLVQAENAYNESTNNYFSKLLTLYIARINLEQGKGNLLNYINK
ncbi:MAG TPA: TolC family protein [Bacteroidales bacterium]|nr:TolC family protein [Bacteroidales bacterium]